ncbi:hypothetical protein RHSIM_Rhsim01G0083000 [Rhododendron simsii]|uniref:Uncharacterized protein n=1 Tax=Rhododendron simsii TaxID=118357 RepID=A0A834HFY9_RHOSS|nr:hypothetical protein RHSIM_Rhsim01G0083000 [Rhododendron simsii]
MADEEAQQLQSFQAAVSLYLQHSLQLYMRLRKHSQFLSAVLAAQSTVVHEATETLLVPEVQEKRLVGRKNLSARPSGMIIKVKPQAKKAKIDTENLDSVKSAIVDADKLRSCCS